MNDLVVETSARSVDETVGLLLEALARRSLTLFARIDHAQGAREAGLELRDEILLVFGSATAGTPLMQQDARVGLDLPLKLLVWDTGGQTAIGYHDPRSLAARYTLTATEALERMHQLLAGLAAEAAP